MDNSLCGGGGSTLSGNALKAVKAAIFMGDPHNRAGLPYNVGTCKAQGVSLPYLLFTSFTDSIPVCCTS
jgi:acetylxylan esterase